MQSTLWMLFLIPAGFGVLLLLIPETVRRLHGVVNLLVTLVVIGLSLSLWGKNFELQLPWVGWGIDFQLRFYAFSQFIVTAIAAFSLLVGIYSLKFMEKLPKQNQFYGFFLISEAMAIGAALSNNLLLMLFFWEGLLITLFGMINLGNPKAYLTAIKAFVIVGLSDLCLMLGIGITGIQAKTMMMSQIHLEATGLNAVAYVLMLIGAMGKAGAMPFHTWIPEAAKEAPLPFMAILPAALEKLLGVYLIARITLDFFTLTTGLKLLVMTIGAVTIILAVMMALIQKDYKRLLSYHAISQVGYMILGIGTGIPIGIAGGLFHMINHAMYKCCLFLTSGSVEKQTGTTDLRQLSGLRTKMPVTFACFLVAAASISGVPPFNGFVSKELIFEGTLESGYVVFFIVAAIGAVLTTASFLKLGHAVYFGKPFPVGKENKKENKKEIQVTEAHWSMLLPMIVLGLGCLIFGVAYQLPLNGVIKPALATSLGHEIQEVVFHYNFGPLFWVTILILSVALLNHYFGVKRSGSGLGASEHIHHAPLLKNIYGWAEASVFDPYVQARKVGRYLAQGLYLIDRGIDWCYQKGLPGLAGWCSETRRIHNGHYANYLAWALGGLVVLIIYFTL